MKNFWKYFLFFIFYFLFIISSLSGKGEFILNIRTDLAIESIEMAGEILPPGVTSHNDNKEGVEINTVVIDNAKGAEALGKPEGNYLTFTVEPLRNVHDNFEGEVSVISEKLSALLPENGLVLVIGLGNSDITPDALGPFSARKILATRHIAEHLQGLEGLSELRHVAAISPGVLGQTGIETAEIIHSVVDKITPTAVIAIDALASKNIDRLGCTIQISDTGISPGGGVQNKRKALNKDTLGIPVIAVGVPTVVDMSTIAYDMFGGDDVNPEILEKGKNFMVTPREIDTITEQAANLVSASINQALQPSLTMEEIAGLTA